MAGIGFNSFNAYSRMSYGLNTRQTTGETTGAPTTPSTSTTSTGVEICASTFNFDNYTDFWRTLGKGIYKKGDTVTFPDANGKPQKYVARELNGNIIFDNGTDFIQDQAR